MVGGCGGKKKRRQKDEKRKIEEYVLILKKIRSNENVAICERKKCNNGWKNVGI